MSEPYICTNIACRYYGQRRCRCYPWMRVASPQNLGPQTSQQENSAWQWCKRRKLVIYEGGYWRLTDVGRDALRRS